MTTAYLHAPPVSAGSIRQIGRRRQPRHGETMPKDGQDERQHTPLHPTRDDQVTAAGLHHTAWVG